MKYITFIAAFLWIFLILWPLSYCISKGCSGPDLDGFMPAFLLTPYGLPCFIWTIFYILKKIWPNSAAVQVIEKTVWIMLAVAVIGGIMYLHWNYQNHRHLILYKK